jgi:hypothetical protein
MNMSVIDNGMVGETRRTCGSMLFDVVRRSFARGFRPKAL